jgi:hypothetical protein
VLETNGDGSKQAHSANGPKTNTQNEKQTKSAEKGERKAGGRADTRAEQQTKHVRGYKEGVQNMYSNNM